MDIYVLVAPVATIFAILGPVLWLSHSDRKNSAAVNEKLSAIEATLASHGERLSAIETGHGRRLSGLESSSKETLAVLVGVDGRSSRIEGFLLGVSGMNLNDNLFVQALSRRMPQPVDGPGEVSDVPV